MECREDNELLAYLRKARHVSAYWKVLGVFLRVRKSRLDTIQLENHKMDSCMLEMLHSWMKQDGHHSKEKLEDALKELYSNPEKYSYHASADSMTISSATQTEIMKYQDEFLDLMWDAARALKERFPDHEELAMKVNEILKEPKSRHVMFETPPTSHCEIFIKLQKEWSYTNPKLLRLLIQRTARKSAEIKHPVTRRSKRTARKHAASSALKERMESYCQRYQSFCKSLQITTASRIVFEAFDSSKPCLNLTIQKGPLALEEIYIFLEEEFDIHNRYFRIHRIVPGSIKVILQFPASMIELIKTCIEQKCNTVNCFAKESPKHHKVICTMKIELPEKQTDYKQPTALKKHRNDSQDMLNPDSRSNTYFFLFKILFLICICIFIFQSSMYLHL